MSAIEVPATGALPGTGTVFNSASYRVDKVTFEGVYEA
jgi:hypothetical protein